MGQGQSQFEENQAARHAFKPYVKDQTYEPEDDDDDNVSQVHWQDTARTDYWTGYAEPGTTKHYSGVSEQGEKLIPQQTARTRRVKRFQLPRGRLVKPLLCLLACLVIVVFWTVHILTTINFNPYVHPAPPSITHIVYHVGSAPTLIIHDDHSQLDIHVGSVQDPGSVVIQTSDGSTLKSNSVANTINVMDTASDGQIDITVPARIDLQIVSDDGPVSVAGINGKVDISTQIASVQLTASTLLSSSQVKTLTGPIALDAQFDPQGSYLFTSFEGDVTVATSPDQAVHFIPSSLAGTIHNQIHSNVSVKGHQAQVQIQTTTGAISIGNG